MLISVDMALDSILYVIYPLPLMDQDSHVHKKVNLYLFLYTRYSTIPHAMTNHMK